MNSKRTPIFAATLLTLALVGCHPKAETPTTRVLTPATFKANVTFTDATKEAGINFRHVSGASENKLLPETMGSGLAWIDYDGDGYQDLFLVNSREWTPDERKRAHLPPKTASGPAPTCHLYHNNGNGTFTDVTEKAGLNIPMYGMGVAVGDYDNDGHPDLYVTGLGHNYLFHNNGNGTFTDVAQAAGVQDGGYSTSAAWVDYDKDGKLDLVVCHYVQWSPQSDIAFNRLGKRIYGTPQQYVGQPLSLYHNEGGGKFKEVAEKAGLRKAPDGRKLQGKSLGVTVCDYDGDGNPDIAIANDTEQNYLFHNEGNGTFKEVGVAYGVAYGDTGAARGAMGIDACDYDHKGKESILIGNFSNQMLALYHNDGAIFRDVASQTGVGPASLLSLSFGCFFVDLDNDGWPDLYIANGHVDDYVEADQKEVKYAERPLVFRNLGNGNFASVGEQIGAPMSATYVARGAAYADYDLDGNVDIAQTTNNGPAYLFHNNGGSGNGAIRLELEGVKSNRSAIGAKVEVKAGGMTQMFTVRSGSSYCAQSELPITVGMGKTASADTITIKWPSGETTTLNSIASGQMLRVVEGKGVTSQRPFGPAKRTARL